ncbi:MAG: hypothetical protein SPK94_07880 [Bacteroidales bacterium]|nr:hypothetical protein [Bacteroidales bacterium]
MKIIKLPCETKVKCEICGCEYEFDNDDVCISSEILRNFAGDFVENHSLYIVCPFCRTKKELFKEEK